MQHSETYTRVVHNTPGAYDLLSLDKKITLSLDKLLMSLYLYGVDIGVEKERYLIKKGLINSLNIKNSTIPFESNHRVFENVSDGITTAVHGGLTQDKIDELQEIVRKDIDKTYSYSDLHLTKENWTPEGNKIDFEKDFWEWIININKGFQHYESYYKFDLYVRQAEAWIRQGMNWNPNASIEAKKAYLQLERQRMLTNSLYALNKFAYIKSDAKSNKYEAWKSQQIMLYLLDLQLSYMMGKARQIGATTTLGAATGVKTMLTTNMYCKLVAQRTTKTEELFRDKVKYIIDKFPPYVTPSVNSSSVEKLEFARQIGKNKTIGPNSIFEISPPTSDCINGGSPTITLLDEIGYFDNLSEILSEGRPTLMGYDPEYGTQVFKRQVIAWGTGGEMDKGGAAMESEFYAAKEAWMERDFTFQIVPLFLNVFARKGFTISLYNSEKSAAYKRNSRPGEKDPKIFFHQANPVTEEDMFLVSSETIIPVGQINNRLMECKKQKDNGFRKYAWGYLAPIYNMNVKMGPDSDVPYEIIGAKFVPASDEDKMNNPHKSGVCIIIPPEQGWIDRYYEGTDPIFTSSGSSNQASAIWDALINDVVAYVDFRIEDYRYCYLQSLLLKLYYSPVKMGKASGCKELVESNVGGEYVNYNKDKKLKHTLTMQAKIPDILQLGGVEVGINKRSKNAPFIINHLEQLLLLHMNNIFCDRFWEQLKTFVKKETTQSVRWEPQNKKFHKDDVLDAVVYSYINAISHKNLIPRRLDTNDSQKKKYRYVMGRDGLELKKVSVRT